MIKIYHNPRCRKSREGLEFLEKSGKKFEVVKYLEDVPSKEELSQIINSLGIKPEKLVRKNEAIWKEKFKHIQLSDDEVIEAMVLHPKLIERPIVIQNGTGAIGRPLSNIENLIL